MAAVVLRCCWQSPRTRAMLAMAMRRSLLSTGLACSIYLFPFLCAVLFPIYHRGLENQRNVGGQCIFSGVGFSLRECFMEHVLDLFPYDSKLLRKMVLFIFAFPLFVVSQSLLTHVGLEHSFVTYTSGLHASNFRHS